MIELSVVVLAYNEEASLEATVHRILDVMKGLEVTYEVVIVEDGSTDSTRQIAESLAEQHDTVRVVFHDHNQGSGMAIRSGVENSRGEKIIYVPADGQFNVAEIKRFLIASELADIVIGARLERSDYTVFRLLSSRVFLLLVRTLFGTTFRDVNWVHLWHRRVFEECYLRSTGVFLLEEIIVRATRKRFSFVEIESDYRPRQGGQATGGNPVTIAKTIRDMLNLRLELWLS